MSGININKQDDPLRITVGDFVNVYSYAPAAGKAVKPSGRGVVSRIEHIEGRITEKQGPGGPISNWAIYVNLQDIHDNETIRNQGYWQDYVAVILQDNLSSKDYDEIMLAEEIMEQLS